MRYSAAFALLLAMLAQGGLSAQQGSDAASLLALHRAYVGWQFGDGTFNTLRMTGHNTWTTNGTTQNETWIEVRMGVAYRDSGIDARTGEGFDLGFTGRIFWDSDENGFTRPDYSTYQNFAVSESVFSTEGTTELTGTLESAQTINGTSYPVVRITPPNGDAIDLAVDPKTGAYVQVTIDPGGSYERTYDDLVYMQVLPGRRVLSGYRVGTVTTQVTKIEPNVPVSANDLHPPAQRATWSFTNQNPFHVDVRAHAIFVNASINGVPGRFILDTGASGIFVSNEYADRAHLATIATTRSGGIGPNTLATRIRRADTLSIGGNTLSNVLIYTSHFDMLEDNERPDGLLGFSLLAGAIVRLNTSDQTMTFLDPQVTPVDRTAGAVVLVDLRSEVPVVPMLIDNRVSVNALLDMGDGVTVSMSPELVSKRHIPMMAHADSGNVFYHPEEGDTAGDYMNSHVVVQGVGGTEVESCSTISSISLGPIIYQSTYACVSPSMSGDNIIVGYDFLRNFDFVFDYREGLIILKPHAT
jgi:predicted aspartyl protease